MAPLAIRRDSGVTAAVLVTETVAVTCQFVQHTDPRFPLLYFTVDSAVLAAVTAAITLTRPQFRYLPALRVTSAVAVVVSALIFATVIAPATPTGTWIQPHDDNWVATATILMHGVAPLLVSIALPSLPLPMYLRYGYLWPVVYLAALVVVATLGSVPMPYPFLAPSQIGCPGAIASAVALAAIIAAVSCALYGLNRLLRIQATQT
ncbi:hypothetical protein MycrhDRAFT_5534 [Mycolicibacterium rhodesiae JS60]|nr:hypothetical protein MycrhDRAFT_5534 [Mycolicibacterium rhodesiae JS60]